MANLVVLSVTEPVAKLRGRLQRVLLEIDTGVFIGRLPARWLPELWSAVCENSKAAFLVRQSKNEIGYSVKMHGHARHEVVDNYGIPLMAIRRNR